MSSRPTFMRFPLSCMGQTHLNGKDEIYGLNIGSVTELETGLSPV
jgi:hypothetical protein